MSSTSNRHLLPVFALAVLIVSGCSDPGESSFVYSERTRSLISEAQNGYKGHKGVRQLVDERFGDPQHLQAWRKMPIDFGGLTGSVATDPAGSAVKELYLQFSAEAGIPESVTEVQLITGKCAGEVAEVLRWNAETGQATLVSVLKNIPSVGDVVSVGGGEVLKSGRMLYQRHCSHCHGTSGDGNGPTAQYLYPRPRDYRHGVFKFTSTNDQSKASRDDLDRILRQGIPGTYMPSFLLLKDEEIHALIEYVRFLSIRGEFERKLVNELASDFSTEQVAARVRGGEKRPAILESLDQFLQEDLPEAVDFVSEELARAWSDAQDEESLVVPSIPRIPDSPESRRFGRELYLSRTLNCADCHGVYAQGNGPQTTIYEKNPVTNELYPEPGLHDVWDNVNQPRNLVQGIYRGGRRPIDLFARIHAGIKGSRMPSFKNAPHEDIWHIVNYVLSIPFEIEPGAPGSATSSVTAAVDH